MLNLIQFAILYLMKKDTHPKYYPNTKVKCACGANFEFGSTMPSLEVEICSACHPFYTGKERIIETGRVERFKQRLAKKGKKIGLKLKEQK